MALYRTADVAKKHRDRFFDIQRGKCLYCQCQMTLELPNTANNYATFEHVVPKSNGGKKYCNIVLVCSKCNSTRKSRNLTDDEFFRTRDALLTIIAYNITRYLTTEKSYWKQFLDNIN